ncbi:MAG: phytanoyl-CoA dioxygenase family protein [bacterium]|nr:phytanoyl-CoA dioxygenase family protein [bacterium]
MELTKKQKLHFHDEGYVVVKGVVPKVMIDRALHAINHSLGEEGMNRDDLPTLRAQSYCKELRPAPVLTDLFNRTPIMPLAESMMGKGAVLPVGNVQIALRFPRPLGEDAPEPRGHLDGLGSGLNGSAKGTYKRGFSALAVILLCDLPHVNSGNFTVFPKSHRIFAEYFKTHGHQVLENGMPRIDLPDPPVMITGMAGDVVLTHHQIVHGAGPHTSPHIRYAAITRLRHKDCEVNGQDAYTDIWREWPGVTEALAEKI